MYTVYRNKFGLYQMKNERTGFTSAFMPWEFMAEMLDYFGVKKADIDAAHNTMLQTGDNIAEFGMNKTFVYTRKLVA